MALADRGMSAGLRAISLLASSDLLDRLGLREPAQRLLYSASKQTVRTATRAGRTFTAAQRLGRPARQPRAPRNDLFDVTPDDEQAMMRDAVREFALDRLRPAAQAADAACAPSPELLTQAGELGLTVIGVPEELGGALSERSAVTATLVSEALATGDLGLAVACLAPAAVATAISLWGDADQQSKYLAPFAGESPPAAALAIMEPRPLFDPLNLRTRAHETAGGYVIDGVKSFVPRAAEAELLIVAAEIQGRGPALFIVEPGIEGLSYEAEPGLGARAGATARLVLEGVAVGSDAVLAGGSAEVYRDCVALSRLGWCALACGVGQAVLDYVIPYVNERRAFGEPVANRQGVAFAVANIAIELEGMRLATLRAAARVDQGLPFAREVAIARRLCAEHGATIGSEGVQLLGGHGYVKEHPVERWYRDLRAAGVLEGGVLV